MIDIGSIHTQRDGLQNFQQWTSFHSALLQYQQEKVDTDSSSAALASSIASKVDAVCNALKSLKVAADAATLKVGEQLLEAEEAAMLLFSETQRPVVPSLQLPSPAASTSSFSSSPTSPAAALPSYAVTSRKPVWVAANLSPNLKPHIVPCHAWLVQNLRSPYPSDQVREQISVSTDTPRRTVDVWFTNARHEIGWTAHRARFRTRKLMLEHFQTEESAKDVEEMRRKADEMLEEAEKGKDAYGTPGPECASRKRAASEGSEAEEMRTKKRRRSTRSPSPTDTATPAYLPSPTPSTPSTDEPLPPSALRGKKRQRAVSDSDSAFPSTKRLRPNHAQLLRSVSDPIPPSFSIDGFDDWLQSEFENMVSTPPPEQIPDITTYQFNLEELGLPTPAPSSPASSINEVAPLPATPTAPLHFSNDEDDILSFLNSHPSTSTWSIPEEPVFSEPEAFDLEKYLNQEYPSVSPVADITSSFDSSPALNMTVSPADLMAPSFPSAAPSDGFSELLAALHPLPSTTGVMRTQHHHQKSSPYTTTRPPTVTQRLLSMITGSGARKEVPISGRVRAANMIAV